MDEYLLERQRLARDFRQEAERRFHLWEYSIACWIDATYKDKAKRKRRKKLYSEYWVLVKIIHAPS